MPVVVVTAATNNIVAKTRHARVRLWGGGGPGGTAQGNPSMTGGGAGGQYAESRVTLVPGTTYAAVGAATRTPAVPQNNGFDSTFNSTIVVAKGGVGAANVATNGGDGTGGAGSTTGGVGDTVFAGGTGGTSVIATPLSGGGGGGAGSTGTGNNASGGTAGVAKDIDGGAGGAGVAAANTRNAGGSYGGGGSGGYASGAADRAGGDGAAGQAIVDWLPPMLGIS